MSDPDSQGGEILLALAETKMPFGRYAGRSIKDLPEQYLLWFRQKGFPTGRLGGLMALALEIKINGLDQLVQKAIVGSEPPGSGRS